MKRQKRDRMGRAHARGYQAGLSGRPRDTCPYQATEARTEWFGGWREAFEDRGSGLFTVK